MMDDRECVHTTIHHFNSANTAIDPLSFKVDDLRRSHSRHGESSQLSVGLPLPVLPSIF